MVVWRLLEINIISFTAFKTEKTKESSKNETIGILKYFLIQSLASAIIILIILYSQKKDQKWTTPVIITVLVTKIAAAPIHRWFIDLIKTIRITKSILLITWQKSMPLLVVTATHNNFLWFFVITSAILPTIEILNTLKTLEILALSSVFNNRWLLTRRQLRTTVTLMFTFLYWSAVILIMKEMKNRKSITNRTPSTRTITFTFLANLRSLPPTTGFVAKWILSIKIIKAGLLTQATTVIAISLVNTYTYIRLCSSNLIENKRRKKNKKSLNKVALLTSVSAFYIL